MGDTPYHKFSMQQHWLKYQKINFFISWTMYMWVCCAPGEGYNYFGSSSNDLTFAIFTIVTTVFGWLWFFWNIVHLRPDTVNVVISLIYCVCMFITGALSTNIDVTPKRSQWQIDCIWGAASNAAVSLCFVVAGWFNAGRPMIFNMNK